MKAVVTALKFHPTSETHGYAIEQVEKKFRIVFVEVQYLSATERVFLKEGNSYSRGRPHEYDSLKNAEYIILTEILPLYKVKTAK